MAENKQNSENRNMGAAGENKPTTGGATSTQPARAANDEANKSGSQGGGAFNKKPASQPGDTMNSAKETLDTVKESVGAVATEALGQAKEKAGSVLDEQKTNLASGITSVADSIRQVGENLGGSQENNQVAALAGKYGESLAGQVEKLSSYIDDKDIRELARDVEQFARRNPVLFVGGAFALGILAARFLKSSGRSQASRKRSGN